MGGLDSRPIPLEAGQDAWYQLREHITYRQEELRGDFVRALQGLMKQRYLDVWGAAGWIGTTLEVMPFSCEGLHSGEGYFPGPTDCQGSRSL